MALYQPRHVSAQMALDALKKHPQGLNWYAWCKAAGLSSSQLSYGLGLLKDVLQTANGEPLVYKTSAGVYKLASTRVEADIYVLMRLRSEATQVRRTIKTIEASNMKFGSTAKRKQILKNAQRVVEDLEDLITLI